ncbi:MAG: trimethylamine methyltransferase family protein [Bacillota bacterium]|nr:trimethylamine methyltransferase family protein [Bacillota bacterium]
MNKFSFFNEEDIKRIHQGTLRVLENTGIIVDDDEVQKLFADAGATVDGNM